MATCPSVSFDALKYLKQYLVTRTNLTPSSLLFRAYDGPAKPTNTKDVSKVFRLIRALEETGAIKLEIHERELSEQELHNLSRLSGNSLSSEGRAYQLSDRTCCKRFRCQLPSSGLGVLS